MFASQFSMIYADFWQTGVVGLPLDVPEMSLPALSAKSLLLALRV